MPSNPEAIVNTLVALPRQFSTSQSCQFLQLRCYSFTRWRPGSQLCRLGDTAPGATTRAQSCNFYSATSKPQGNHRRAPIEYIDQSVLRYGGLQAREFRIAVLGGGITGLACAHYIARDNPHAEITIFEKSNRLGGWIYSEFVDVANGKILLEQGPRTLRYGSATPCIATTELIDQLHLEDQIVTNPKDSVAARNKFVYYPNHLVRMPGPGQGLITILQNFTSEPVFSGLFSSILEPFRATRCPSLLDESVASFITRRMGSSHVADNLVSAIFHGIYAGDIYKLSARCLLRSMWKSELERGSVAKGIYSQLTSPQSPNPIGVDDFQLVAPPAVHFKLLGASVYSFKEGLATLPAALEKKLRKNPNVQFKMNESVTGLKLAGGDIQVTTSPNFPQTYTHVVSTLSPAQTSCLTRHLPSLSKIPAVTVMVINLFFRSPTILPVHGFGYLIPHSIPFEQNPECALGVVFDSDAISGQDKAEGTKVTVMLGGHWWDDFTSYPDEEQGARMAQAVLRRHLGIEEQPELIRVSLQKDCIPQYLVGHHSLMCTATSELAAFLGKLRVAGNGYFGVGVNDCVLSGREAARSITRNELGTGLEQFLKP